MTGRQSQGRFCENHVNGRKCDTLMVERNTIWMCNVCGDVKAKSFDETTKMLRTLKRDIETYHSVPLSPANHLQIAGGDLFLCEFSLPK